MSSVLDPRCVAGKGCFHKKCFCIWKQLSSGNFSGISPVTGSFILLQDCVK